MSSHILLVDDEAPIRELLSVYFRKKGFEVTTALSGGEAMERADQDRFDLAILDVNLAGENGLELLGFLKSNWPDLPLIVFTGMDGDELLLQRAMNCGADGFMLKTEPLEELFKEVTRHLAAAAARS